MDKARSLPSSSERSSMNLGVALRLIQTEPPGFASPHAADPHWGPANRTGQFLLRRTLVWVTTSDRREGFEVTQTRGKGYRHLSDNYWATLDEAMAEAQADHDAGRDVEPKFIERVSVPLRF